MSRIGDKLSVCPSDAHSAQRTFPGNIADHERRGCADDREHVRVVFAIRAQDDALDLDLVVPALGKVWPNGPIDETRGQNFFFRRAAFAFEVTAGKFTRGSGLFAVI